MNQYVHLKVDNLNGTFVGYKWINISISEIYHFLGILLKMLGLGFAVTSVGTEDDIIINALYLNTTLVNIGVDDCMVTHWLYTFLNYQTYLISGISLFCVPSKEYAHCCMSTTWSQQMCQDHWKI